MLAFIGQSSSTPNEAFVSDISTSTNVSSDLSEATLTTQEDWEGEAECSICLSLADWNQCNLCQGDIIVNDPQLWWPIGTSGHQIGILYTLTVTLSMNGTTLICSLPIGLRQVSWTSSGLQVNHQPVYLKGIARHEDSDVRGKGFDYPTLVRDHQILLWMGVNSFRTSHYPYAEETLQLADK